MAGSKLLSDKEIREIAERAVKSTSAELKEDGIYVTTLSGKRVALVWDEYDLPNLNHYNDAAFIVHARADIINLIVTIEGLDDQLKYEARIRDKRIYELEQNNVKLIDEITDLKLQLRVFTGEER